MAVVVKWVFFIHPLKGWDNDNNSLFKRKHTQSMFFFSPQIIRNNFNHELTVVVHFAFFFAPLLFENISSSCGPGLMGLSKTLCNKRLFGNLLPPAESESILDFFFKALTISLCAPLKYKIWIYQTRAQTLVFLSIWKNKKLYPSNIWLDYIQL